MGTLFNAFTVIAGSLTGLLVRSRLPDRYIKIVFTALGLFTIVLGVSMAVQSTKYLLMVFALVLGGIAGELFKIEERLNKISESVGKKIGQAGGKFAEGFTTAFILFCVGSLTILGAFEEGLGGEPNLLITKGVMDGFSSIALSAAFGIGVLFSVVPLVIYQGFLTLFASFLEPFMTEMMINELSAVGGVMIVGIGINILKIKELNVINLLPALLLSPLLVWLFGG